MDQKIKTALSFLQSTIEFNNCALRQRNELKRIILTDNLTSEEKLKQIKVNMLSFSSYEHPFDIGALLSGTPTIECITFLESATNAQNNAYENHNKFHNGLKALVLSSKTPDEKIEEIGNFLM